MIPDTSGKLAAEVFNDYVNAGILNATAETTQFRIDTLHRIAPYVRESMAKQKLENSLANFNTSYEGTLRRYNDVKEDLEHLLYANINARLDDLESTNRSLQQGLDQFENIEKAIAVAKTKNQNYLAKLYYLQAAEEDALSVKSTLTRPSISLVVSDTWNRTQYKNQNTSEETSRDGYVGIQIQYSIRAGIKNTLRAESKKVKAAKAKTEKETEDFSYDIRSNFAKLATADSVVADQRKNIRSVEEQIEFFVKEHARQGQEINLEKFDFLISLFDELGQSQSHYYSALFEAIVYRYSLQQDIGILFEAIQAANMPSN